MDPSLVGGLYIALGLIGASVNGATALMIVSKRVYRLSAYTMMANVALADAIMMLVAGLACGILLIWPAMDAAIERPVVSYGNGSTVLMQLDRMPVKSILCFLEIAAGTAGVVSYAYLGMNRCIAICFYGTRAKALNRVAIAIGASLLTWTIGTCTALMGTMPEPLMGVRRDMWTVTFVSVNGNRPAMFMLIAVLINSVSICGQWICSTLVLLKIRQVRLKISRNKLNQNSANRFRKQARLTFQFFYPSLLCTLSSMIYFAKPYMVGRFSEGQFVALHLFWLCHHMCNPFIYAYFNDRMRQTYFDWLTCAYLRYRLQRKHLYPGFTRSGRHNVSRRSDGRGGKEPPQQRMSTRSVRSGRDGNFVRNSLQMQSRDFEQLCEFMMRVNPLYDSSEGWRESSGDEEAGAEEHAAFNNTHITNMATSRGCISMGTNDTSAPASSSREHNLSIVMGLGRDTVEQWVKFAKKASI